ncbi:MAG: efflux RND transporter periplasmic adaptor subunit [Alphaproteobacteria bacterium]|nr:efflux RND transporter periplasmic adaptor subunit [Alphaproteobacteria bacterium]
MKVVRLSKRKMLLQLIVLAACVAFGWELKTRLTPAVDHQQEGQVPYVVTTEAAEENVSPQKKYIATVEAINGVDVKAQATGYLNNILFEEGGFVKQGQTLFIIEQGRYKEAVISAAAEVARTKANLKQIENDHKRNQVLFKQKVLTASNIEASESALAQARAAVKAAEAHEELAKINLGYTKIVSPIDGYIGKALMTKGNYIDMSGRPMARIVQVSPIRVSFSVTDRDRLEAVRLQAKEGSFAENVKIILPDESVIPVKPLKTFFDSEINPATATVAAYIDVENADKLLLPGNHVDVVVQLEKDKPAVLVPQEAIIQDQQGVFVYTVNAENKAQKAYVKTGNTENGRTVIIDGVSAGTRIIVQGIQKVENGSEVRQSFVK